MRWMVNLCCRIKDHFRRLSMWRTKSTFKTAHHRVNFPSPSLHVDMGVRGWLITGTGPRKLPYMYSYLRLSVTPKWKIGCCSNFYTFRPNSSISYTSMISAMYGFQVLNDLLQPISYMRGIFREGAFLGKTSQCNTGLGYSHMSPRPYHLQQSGN
jgi:hypothetical protein